MDNNEKMEKFVRYYLGDHAESISSVVLTHLARRLDDANCPYCCFWAFLMNNWEKSKLTYRNFLQSDIVWEKFIKFRIDRVDQTKVFVGLELDRFMTEIRISDVYDVLTGDRVLVSPVVRYTMARCMGVPEELYAQYKDAAIQQLREEPYLIKAKEGFPITEEEVMRNE